jgi:sigma-B regulation protein RsbQ
MFAHGFGCDQNMWRLLEPHYRNRYRTILFDLMGNGQSDLRAFDYERYATLDGYADDVLQILDATATEKVVFIGHSVSAMIGLLAAIRAPARFHSQVMVGPSPCYLNDGKYMGGFSREDIDDLLRTMDSNYLGWSSSMAPAIMGAPGQPELSVELTNSFCRTDPTIARHFARVTFLSDLRDRLPLSPVPSLLLQCSDDIIAPMSVGRYMAEMMPDSRLEIIENVGHCPHLSAPGASVAAIDSFLRDKRVT